MQHPFVIMKPEYTQLLAAMQVRHECIEEVNKVAVKLLGYKSRYQVVSAKDGVPVVFIAASFEREASSDFTKNAAQGWPLTSRSRWVPPNGPFQDWASSAIAAYHLNGLDRVGADSWTWELMCFYGEMFNGFGYRDFHHMHSPYLFGGTNIQTVGKYTSDDKFDAEHMDTQLGIVPVMRRMVELDHTLALSAVPYVAAPPIHSGIATMITPASGMDPEIKHDTRWAQHSLNQLGFWPPLSENGNYNFVTKISVERFQADYGIHVDGLVGDETTKALIKAIAALPAPEAKP